MKTKDFLRHGLIGLKAKVLESKNKSCNDVQGVVVDETKNTITIKTNNKEKKMLKNVCVFEFEINNNKVVVNGKNIQKKPTERIKVKR